MRAGTQQSNVSSAMAAPSAAVFCCCLSSPPPQTFESTAARLVSSGRGGTSLTAAISASSPLPRRGLKEEQRILPTWALSGPVAPTSANCREGDGGSPNRMVAEVYEQSGGPQPQHKKQEQQQRGPFPRPPVIPWEKDVANAVQLIGRVEKGIDIKYLDTGKVVATTSLAVHKGFQRTEDPSWFTLEICDDLAEIAARHVAEGELIFVSGRIVVDNTVKDGIRCSTVKVAVRDLCFVEPSCDQRQAYGQSNDGFTVRGSRSQCLAESMDLSQRNWNQQQLSRQPSPGAFAGFEGARGHGNSVAQLEAQSPETRSQGASKWREAAKMIEQNRNSSHEAVGGIESRQQNTDSSKVGLKRVGDVSANFPKSITAIDLLKIREPDPLSGKEEGQSLSSSGGVVTESSVRQDLITEEPLSTSLKARPNLIAHARLQSRASYSNRVWSRDTVQGNGSTHMLGAGTTSEGIAGLQNRIQRGITTDSSTYIKILRMCLQQKDLSAAKQVHDLTMKSGMDKNPYVASTLLNVYIKCGGLLDARRVFDELENKTLIDWTVMIAAYANNENAAFAFELFKLMRQKCVRPDQVTYLSVLKACASPSALKWGQEVHECLRQDGFESDMRVGTALLMMYSTCGCITEARRVFEKLTNRSVITWTGMIAALSQHGCGHEAYQLFLQMRREGFEPNAFTYASILNPAASAGALEWVKKVHGHACKAGLESELRVGSALVHMYAKCGSSDDARLVFDRMKKRDEITWNIMIGAYAESGRGMEAYGLFLRMRREGFEPNAFTYASILNASASAGALEWVKKVHGHACKAGLESDLRVGNALVHMYAKSGSIGDARLVFDRMEKRDVITWNIMIGAHAESGRGTEAYGLFLQMRREGFKPDAFTYASILNASPSEAALGWVREVHGHARISGLELDLHVGNALVHMYAKSGSIGDARLVFDRMEKRDVITWNIMIGAHAESGRGTDAYGLFVQMRREGFEPDAFTYASILNASASEAALGWVREVHGHARISGLALDLCVGNALVHMYAKSGSIDEARVVFDGMEIRDIVTWTVMIGGLAQHGYGHEALELFRKMTMDRVKPNEFSFVAVLSACSHGGLVDDGRKIFSSMMQDYGIEPTIMHYNCMVDLLGRAGHLEEAKQFISDMPVEPDAVTWKALLGACRTYGNVELGELTAQEVFKLEPNDASAYVLLSNIYAAAGEWEKVSSVRTMMQERRVRKEPGRSWIEVDNKIHQFVVGDTSHPEAEAIYAELKNLGEKLKAEGYIPDTRLVLHDINEEDKELALCSHSERLAIAYGLIHLPCGEPIRVSKNLRVCSDCHSATKYISKVTGREIIARDANRFHHFKDGVCSCGDYW